MTGDCLRERSSDRMQRGKYGVGSIRYLSISVGLWVCGFEVQLRGVVRKR